MEHFLSREIVVQSHCIRRPGNVLFFCRGLFLRLSRRALHQQTAVNEVMQKFRFVLDACLPFFGLRCTTTIII